MAEKNEKKLYKFPSAKKSEKRIQKLLPEFIREHPEDLPEGFAETAHTLFAINTSEALFQLFLTEKGNRYPILEACEFISQKTSSKEGAARALQDELVNGFLRRWWCNIEKIQNQHPDLKKGVFRKTVAYSEAGGFIQEIMQDLLKVNIVSLVKESKEHDSRLEGVGMKQWSGTASRLLTLCLFTYKETRGAHFKTLLSKTFAHFGEHYARDNDPYYKESLKGVKITNFSGFEREDGEDALHFVDRHVDPKSASPVQETHRKENIDAVRKCVGLMGERDRKIIEKWLELQNSKELKNYVKEEWSIKGDGSAKGHINRALRNLKSVMEEHSHLKDIASDEGRG